MSKEIDLKAHLLPFITSALEKDEWEINAKSDPAKSLSYRKEFSGVSIEIHVTELDDCFSISFGSLQGLSKPTKIKTYFSILER